jgi:hypothetical protein
MQQCLDIKCPEEDVRSYMSLIHECLLHNVVEVVLIKTSISIFSRLERYFCCECTVTSGVEFTRVKPAQTHGNKQRNKKTYVDYNANGYATRLALHAVQVQVE